MYDKFKELGIDTAGALSKLGGKKEMYERFLKRFASDPNFEEMLRNFEMGHFDTMLTKAHNLSGTAKKLGMEKLSKVCAAIVSDITKGDTSNLKAYVEEASSEYEKIIAIIKE